MIQKSPQKTFGVSLQLNAENIFYRSRRIIFIEWSLLEKNQLLIIIYILLVDLVIYDGKCVEVLDRAHSRL